MTNMNGRKILLLAALILLCAAAIARLGGSIYSFRKFQRAQSTLRSPAAQRQNAANVLELPDVDFSRLTEKQKQEARRRLNTESCTCGCKLTMAECRINDTSCPISKALAAQVVKEVASGKASPQPSSDATKPASD